MRGIVSAVFGMRFLGGVGASDSRAEGLEPPDEKQNIGGCEVSALWYRSWSRGRYRVLRNVQNEGDAAE